MSKYGTGQTQSHNVQEFNHGLVLSAAPLLDNQMVEVSDIYIYDGLEFNQITKI